MTQNQIAYWTLQENQRANKVRENETNRHNVIDEALTAKMNNSNIEKNAGQIARWENQNSVDIAKAITGGVKDIGSVVFGKGGMAGAMMK